MCLLSAPDSSGSIIAQTTPPAWASVMRTDWRRVRSFWSLVISVATEMYGWMMNV